jgi:lipooligosaccharide transport system permease protein
VTSREHLLLRIAPPSARPSRRVGYVLERNWLVYRKIWKLIIAGFFEPVFYLFAIGIGLGSLIGDLTLADGSTVPYAAFVAPGMLAASAMNGAVYESTFNIFFKFKYGRVYQAMLATPLGSGDIALGEITWSLIRGLLYSTAFLGVMALMGLATSWWALGALGATLLIGLAFAAVGMAATTWMRSWQDFDLVTFVTLPLFLFSATFYPLDVYPPVIQSIAKLSPLYHGAELVRSFTLGTFGPGMLTHVTVLVGMAVVGGAVAVNRLQRLLLA